MKNRIALLVLALVCMIGLFAITATADEAPTASIEGHNLSLNDNIYIIYYASFQNVSDDVEKGVLVWTSRQESYEYGTQYAILPVYTGNNYGYSAYYFTGVSAKMMTQDIYAKAYVKIGDEITYGELDKYSVLQYCYNKKGSETKPNGSTITLGELIQDILHYGASAQKYFNFNPDRLATANYYEIKVVGGMLPDTTKSGLFQLGEQVTLTGPIGIVDYWENTAGETVGTESTLVVTVSGAETYTAVEKMVEPPEPDEPIFYSEGLYFISNGDGTCYVAGIGTCTDTDIRIPPVSPDEDSVTAIGEYAFYECSSLTSVEFPDSVTSIGEGAFWGCTALTSITIPNSITSILEGAFSDCTSLASMTVAEGNSVYHSAGNCIIETATKTLIAGCKNSIIPDDGTVTKIGIWAFARCTELTSIVIPAAIEDMSEQGIFIDCSKLASVTFAVGSKLEMIGALVFDGCTSLSSIDIPASVVRIEDGGVFSKCNSLINLTVEEGNPIYHSAGNCIIETATKTLIAGCKNSLIPDDGSVTSIGKAFFGCTSLESITIPDNVTSIGGYAFYRCTSLSSIELSNDLTNIGYYAFASCYNLATIYFHGTEAEWNAIDKGLNWDYNTGDYVVIFLGEDTYSQGLLFVSNGDGTCYVAGIGTCTDTDIKIPPVSPDGDSVTAIGKGYVNGRCTGFYKNATITSVVIPNSVTSIGNYAFEACSSLTSIEIPDSVTSIGYAAFRGCTSLTSVTFGENSQLTSIGSEAFDGCSSLTGIEIPDSVMTISDFAFYKCSSLNSITFGENSQLTSIEFEAFYNCTSLTSIEIPITVKKIGYEVFCNCPNLKTVNYAGTLESWCKIEFYHSFASNPCSNGAELYIGGELLTNAVIPDNITYVGDSLFYGCTSLTSITIPKSVMSVGIGWSAFARCTSLATIYFHGTEAEWNAIEKGEYWDSGTGRDVVGGYKVIFLGEEPHTHVYDQAVVAPEYLKDSATCTTAAVYYYSCTCGEKGTATFESGDPLGHDYTITEITAPTCTNYGYTTYTCTRCGNSYAVVDVTNGAPLGHAWDDGVVTKAPTTTETGIRTYTCARCGATRTETIPKIEYSEGLEFVSNGDGTCYVAGIGTCTDTDIRIPPVSPDEDSVTAIGKGYVNGRGYTGFYKNATITSVTIPNSVTSIGESAFGYCTSLTSITIPNSVTSIGDLAFLVCTALTSVTIGNSVASIGDEVFPNCTALTSMTVAEGNPVYHSAGNCIIETASKTLIAGCKNSVIPADGSVTSIGYRAFYECTSLTRIKIPDSVTSIGQHAFLNCTSLMSIEIPNSVKSIGSRAFGGCKSLTSMTVAEDNPVYHSAGNCIIETATKTLIAGCKNSVIPADGSVTAIREHAFECSSLTSIKIPDSVTSIGRYAFYDCFSLTSIEISNSVKSIGADAFYGCYKLVEVYNRSSLTITKGSSSHGYTGYYAKNIYTDANQSKLSTDENGYILYTDGADKILIGYVGTEISLILPNDITEIYRDAFIECESLTNIKISNSVTSIGARAFAFCSSLASITIPDSVTSIEFRGFYNCTSLTSITYQGTKAQWNAISKGSDWNYSTGSYTIHCTNGDISKQ